MGCIAFQSCEEELAYYKEHTKKLEEELEETKYTLDEFQMSSKELEDALEKEVESTERRYNEIKIRNEAMRQEIEDWKEKYQQSIKESNNNINQLTRQLDTLKQQTETFIKKERELEQDNDDLEKTGRAATWSLKELEIKYNAEVERTAILQGEVAAKAALMEEVQRLKDELRGSSASTPASAAKTTPTENTPPQNPVKVVQDMVGRVKSLEARLASCRSLVTPLLQPPPSYSTSNPSATHSGRSSLHGSGLSLNTGLSPANSRPGSPTVASIVTSPKISRRTSLLLQQHLQQHREQREQQMREQQRSLAAMTEISSS
ncbi:hypothetical protein BGZ68_002855 [Mortierella alpina]|nr:hypothetical protein BGZ68_002855 [Mortierella alpina]